jgi:peptidoglycan/xylan/chitin deacetylase (PgdA/CDA1 family)
MPASQASASQYGHSGKSMNQAQQHSSLHVSEDFSVLPQAARFIETPYRKILGKASRFLARNVATKKLEMRNKRPMISFTFDDVPASACDTGISILEQHGARGTFYIAGAGCGRNSPVGLLASVDQLRAIWSKGNEIGCQTYSHSAVSRLSRSELELEFSRNQSALKKIDGNILVRNFAYPYGDLSFRARRYLETQFDSCRSVDLGINTHIADLGSLKSCPLENASIDRTKIAALIAETVRTNGWLIFFSHDVTERPSRYGIMPELLEWAVNAARQSGCALLPVADGLKLASGLVEEVDTFRPSLARSPTPQIQQPSRLMRGNRAGAATDDIHFGSRS